MSKISDRLAKLGQTETTGFGFGARALTRKIPVILTAVALHKPQDIQDVDADVFIMPYGSIDVLNSETLKDVDLWGVSI